MSMQITPDLDAVHRAMLQAFPPLSRDGQRAGLALYRLLTEIGPTRTARLASALEAPIDQTRALLDEPEMQCQLLFDAAERIIGFGGLAVDPTPHRLNVDGRTAFTWCAWDAFFIPGLLGAAEARAASTCPATGDLVELGMTPQGVSSTDSSEPVLSFTLPDARHCAESTERSITSFCSHVRLIS
jgi:alkylmercury lyase